MSRGWSYERTFKVQACHISDKGYPHLHASLAAISCGDWMKAHDELFKAFFHTHGHNFKVEIVAFGDELQPNGFLVDDVALTEKVMEWNGVNLSLHHDFFNQIGTDGHPLRATTERLAYALWEKLNNAFDLMPFVVTIHETDEVKSTYPFAAGR